MELVTLTSNLYGINIDVLYIFSFWLVTLTIINCYDTRAGASVQVFFTAAKLIALAIIIVGGLVRLGQGKHIDVFAHFKS